VPVPPIVDGLALDECWRKVKGRNFKIPYGDGEALTDVAVKACVFKDRIYLLVQYQTGGEARSHRFWRWDPQKKIYVSTDTREESVSIMLYGGKDAGNDIWVWRACRTDPAGFADDMFLKYGRLSLDVGRPCWYSEYYGSFVGDVLPRFQNRAPEGSAADVKAKGHWDRGRLTVEFSRKLDTKHPDDIPLSKTLRLSIMRSRGD